MRPVAVSAAIALTAGALAACGGSSSPGSSSSRADTSAATAVTASSANATLPIDSPQYRDVIATAAADKGLSPPLAAKVADCIVKNEAKQGYRTVGDVTSSATARQRALQDAADCTTQSLPAG